MLIRPVSTGASNVRINGRAFLSKRANMPMIFLKLNCLNGSWSLFVLVREFEFSRSTLFSSSMRVLVSSSSQLDQLFVSG